MVKINQLEIRLTLVTTDRVCLLLHLTRSAVHKIYQHVDAFRFHDSLEGITPEIPPRENVAGGNPREV